MKSISTFDDARKAGRAQAAQFYAMCQARNMSPARARKDVLSWFKESGAAEKMPLPFKRVAEAEAEKAWAEIMVMHRANAIKKFFKTWGHWFAIAGLAGTLAALLHKLH